MRRNSPFIRRSNFLLLLTALITLSVGLSILPNQVVQAGGGDKPNELESARDSIASCNNIIYRVPQLPAEASSEEYFALPPNADGPVISDLGLYVELIVRSAPT